MPYRTATPDDAPAIASLLNRAYRPAKGLAGWTHESHLVQGERANTAQVAAVLASRASVILLLEQDGELIACIQAERDGDDVHFGMFAVTPTKQAGGLGKTLLAAAEVWAREQWHSRRALMSVIIARAELTDFYLRRGYRRTSQTLPYPQGAGVGMPLRAELPLEILAKDLK
ncbi:GNAT family N-acetyltransferase [Rhodobacteraceae bacterium CH30]|nr:GNAT family N-acetyltransferase [Rhodobacteraceae bacterium CH30]